MKAKKVQEGCKPFNKRNSKGTETDCPHVPKDKLVGLKANLTELCLEVRQKKRDVCV